MKDYIREMRLEDKLMEVNLVNSWEEMVGKAIGVYQRPGPLYTPELVRCQE